MATELSGIVVIIDDLERAHRDELLTVLQIVRLSANFKNTLFILAYDQTQISLQLKNLGIPPDFLDKIVLHRLLLAKFILRTARNSAPEQSNPHMVALDNLASSKL